MMLRATSAAALPLPFPLRPGVAALSLAFFSAHALPAAAQARQLDEVVVSASGFEQEVRNAPASITVITREELETKRISNIADALADIEGIDTGGTAGKTGGLNIRMRGLGDEYTLVLIDGRRQNSTGNIHPNGFSEVRSSFLPPVSAIERIEVVRGPMSTLYGSDAMGGVVNIITRKVADSWTGSLTLEGTKVGDADFGSSYSADVYAAGPLKQGLLGLQVRARHWEREQSHISYELDDGSEGPELTLGRNPTKGRNESYGTRLTLTPNASHDLWLDVESNRQSYDNSESQLGTLGQAGGYEKKQQYNRDKLLLAHNWRLDNGVLESSLSYTESETVGRLIPARLIGRSGDRGLKSEDLIFDTKYVTAIAEHMLSVGGQYWKARMEDGILPAPTAFTQVGVFVEDEWRLRDDLALTLGLRHDRHDEFGGYTTPRAYLVWNTSQHWTLKGGVSKGYKAPRLEYLTNGIYTVVGQGRSPQVGNPDLKPEISVNSEIGAIYDSLQGFSAGATAFHSKYKDFISTSDGPILMTCNGRTHAGGSAASAEACEAYLASVGSLWDVWVGGSNATGDSFTLRPPVNLDEATIRGIELFARWQITRAWQLSANYTYTDSEQTSGANKGDPINDTPEHMVNLALRWKPTERLSAWVRGEYRSDGYRSGTFSSGPNNGRDVRDVVGDWKGYSLMHLGASYKATKHLTVSGTVFNVFDKRFNKATVENGTTYALYRNNQEPRRLWLSASLAF
jgi:outer membrane receptor for ferrienterochelin and colicins